MINEFFDDLQKDLRNFGEGKTPTQPVMAKEMQLRDYFAGQVMSDLVVDYGYEPEALDLLAWRAYGIADALMRERSK